MKNISSLFAIAVLLIIVPAAVAGDNPWFDMEKCAVCKNLLTDPTLMQHFTKWEHYNIANGMLNLSLVEQEYVPAYKKAVAAMDSVTGSFGKGPLPYLCGSCAAFGEIMMAGAKYEEFQSDNIFLSTLTSDKPEVVEKIHTWNERTQAEMAKMSAPPDKQGK